MVYPQVSLLDCTVEAGIPGAMRQALIGGENVMYVPRHDGCLWIWLMKALKMTLIQHVTRIRRQYVTRIRIQHVMTIRIQHLMRIRIQHVIRLRILHVKRIDLVTGRRTIQ